VLLPFGDDGRAGTKEKQANWYDSSVDFALITLTILRLSSGVFKNIIE
jgi:hypothetical protein